MSWAKFDDQYPDHPKIVEVGPLGLALHAAATCYCARYLTDGFVPAAMIGRLVNFDGISVNSNAVTNKDVTDNLIRVGLLEIVPGGFMVHDYLDYNPPSEEIKREKALNAARQKKWREEHRNGDGKFNSNGERNALLTTAPSPSPSPLLNTGATPESETPKENTMPFSDPLWDIMHGEDIQDPQAKPGLDIDWAPADIQNLMTVFIQASSLPAPRKKSDRGYWIGSLRDMRLDGLTSDDIRLAVEKMRADKLTIKAPESVKAVALDLKASRQNGRSNHPLPEGV